MEIIQEFKQVSFSTKTAIISFAIGTSLFLIHLVIPYEENIFTLGFFYVLIAFLINAIVLLFLFYQLIINSENRNKTTIQILILLSNIPIAALYYYLVLKVNIFNLIF